MYLPNLVFSFIIIVIIIIIIICTYLVFLDIFSFFSCKYCKLVTQVHISQWLSVFSTCETK